MMSSGTRSFKCIAAVPMDCVPAYNGHGIMVNRTADAITVDENSTSGSPDKSSDGDKTTTTVTTVWDFDKYADLRKNGSARIATSRNLVGMQQRHSHF